MRVMITGGSGLIGRTTAAHLLDCGFDVHVTDLAAETDTPHTTYGVCDVTDFDAVRENIRGCDAVVHMAALRNPLQGTGHDVFRINTVGTFHVFEAAAKEGIRRVVQASSINAMGCGWNVGEFRPAYLPVDEGQPMRTSDPYALSKHHSEEIGAYFWRRDGISSAALRFPGIYDPKEWHTPKRAAYRQMMVDFLNQFQQLPEDEQARKLAAVSARNLQVRAERLIEYPYTNWPISEEINDDELLWRAYLIERHHLWASMDVRDAARAVELSLTAAFEGAYAMFVNDRHNQLGYDSEALARIFFPDVTARKKDLTGSTSLVSYDLARQVIGFEPKYSPHGEA